MVLVFKHIKNTLFFIVLTLAYFSLGVNHTFAAAKYWVGGGSTTNWGATSPTNWSLTPGGPNNAAVPSTNDDVFFNASSGSGTAVVEANKSIRSIDFTGFTGTFNQSSRAITINNSNIDVSVKFSSGMTYTINSTSVLNLTSGTCTISVCSISLTTAGQIMPRIRLTGQSLGKTLSLQDNLVSSGGLEIINGSSTFNTNNFDMSVLYLAVSLTNPATNFVTLNLGSSTISITGNDTDAVGYAGNAFYIDDQGSSNITINPVTSTLKFTNSVPSESITMTNHRAVNSIPLYNIWFSGTGNNVIYMSENLGISGPLFSFNNLRIDNPPHDILISESDTITVNSLSINGTVGNINNIYSTAGGTRYTISSPSAYIATDYVSITDSQTAGGATFYAGSHSTNGGNNSGWIFDTTPPTATVTYSKNRPVKAGETQRITATFNEAMADSPVVKIALSGNNTVSATNMTKVSSTEYYYDYVVGTGTGTNTVALSVGTDLSSNVITSSPTSGSTFTVDNTAPTNQDTVFASSTSKISNQSVTIVSSGDSNNTIWFAPAGTTSFTAGSTMTTAGGTATSILAPSDAGTYKLFIVDQAGNISTASTATLTVYLPLAVSIDSSTYNSQNVVLNANITSTGNDTVTTRGFEYGLTTSYGLSTSESGSFSSGAFSLTLSNISCGETYHVRAYATNSTTTAYSSDSTFFMFCQQRGRIATSSSNTVVPVVTGNLIDTTNSTPTQDITPNPQINKPSITRILRYGTKGNDVKTLQSYLILHNYLNSTSDGIFGDKTKQAVMKFQKANGLKADGIVGKKTRQVIERNSI